MKALPPSEPKGGARFARSLRNAIAAGPFRQATVAPGEAGKRGASSDHGFPRLSPVVVPPATRWATRSGSGIRL
jgi:hypothetical protein